MLTQFLLNKIDILNLGVAILTNLEVYLNFDDHKSNFEGLPFRLFRLFRSGTHPTTARGPFRFKYESTVIVHLQILFMLGDIPAKPRFAGGFITWRVTLSTQETKGIKDVLLVYSSGSREAVLEYLWLKFVWNQLSKDEFLLFMATLKESDEKKYSFLRRLTKFPKKKLRDRLQEIEGILGLKVSSQQRLSGYYRLRIEIHKETRSLPRTKKYTGWARSASAVGNKGPNAVRQFDEMMSQTEEYSEEVTINWYSLLNVDRTLATLLGELLWS